MLAQPRGPIAQPDHEIQPSAINTDQHFWDAFDHSDTEVSAKWIVRLCQKLGGWVPFSLEQLQSFYETGRGKKEIFRFNRLIDPGSAFSIMRGTYWTGGGWVVLGEDGLYRVTIDFVERCHRSSPVQVAPAA